jgi:hypothetical protein
MGYHLRLLQLQSIETKYFRSRNHSRIKAAANRNEQAKQGLMTLKVGCS